MCIIIIIYGLNEVGRISEALNDQELLGLTLIVTVPLCLYMSPIREERRDDLPAPTDPTRAVRIPGFSVSFMSCSTSGLDFR